MCMWCDLPPGHHSPTQIHAHIMNMCKPAKHAYNFGMSCIAGLQEQLFSIFLYIQVPSTGFLVGE